MSFSEKCSSWWMVYDMSAEEKELVRRIQKEGPILREIPDHWVLRIFTHPQGLEEVYEHVSAANLSPLIRKYLLFLKLNDNTKGCNLCQRVYSNHIHYLLHIKGHEHTKKISEGSSMQELVMTMDMLEIFEDEITKWQRLDCLYYEGKGYYEIVSRDKTGGNNAELIRPTKEFLTDICEMTRMSYRALHPKSVRKLKRKLEEHMDETGFVHVCDFCEQAYCEMSEYVAHCLTFGHVDMMFNLEPCKANEALMNITIMFNESMDAQYCDYMIDNLDSQEYYDWFTHVKKIVHLIPRPSHNWGAVKNTIKEKDLIMVRELMSGKSMDDMKKSEGEMWANVFIRLYIIRGVFPDPSEDRGPFLHRMVEPKSASFGTLARKVVASSHNNKNSLEYIEKMETDVLLDIHKVMCRIFNNGIPHCLYCDKFFLDVEEFSSHLLNTEHHDHFSSFTYTNPRREDITKDCVHEAVQLIFLEVHKRNNFLKTCSKIFHPELLVVFRRNQTHYYCDVCKIPFIDFFFFIAHFWSKSHLENFDCFNVQFSYLDRLVSHMTKDELTHIGKKSIDLVAVHNELAHYHEKITSQYFPNADLRESCGMRTRDAHLTYYVHFYFGRTYESWRKRQTYNRDKGTRTSYDRERHVPDLGVVEKVDKMMRSRFERTPYAWWDEKNVEAFHFQNYFSMFPPHHIWVMLDSHLNKEGMLPYCYQCRKEFKRPDDYYLHFGEEGHPYPKDMDEGMTGLFMLIHIMFLEKRVGVDLDQYQPLIAHPLID